MSKVRGTHASVLQKSKVVVIGGISDMEGTVTNTCEIYDPAQNKWDEFAPMNEPRSGCSAVCMPSQDIYVFGGEREEGAGHDTIEKYL